MLKTRPLHRYTFASGATRELAIYPEDAAEVIVAGLDHEGRVVVNYYPGAPDGGWTFALTKCCNASDKGVEAGVVCRACRGMDGELVNGRRADVGVYNPIVTDEVTA